MDDKTLHALTALANKLGTTAEYLWGVLLRQAPISAVTNLVVLALLVIVWACWARFVFKMTRVMPATESDRWPRAEWREEGAVLAWASVAMSGAVIAIIGMEALQMATYALLNPEYWALRQILK